jgi:putative tryptophan/tyrosine transport system substrate-binding protein
MASGDGYVRRRDFAKGIASSAVAWSFAVHAQQGERVRRIGILFSSTESDALNHALITAFRTGLKEHGWTEGLNFKLELRYAGGKPEQLPMLAADLVQANVDLIVTGGTEPIQAASKATTSIPIVMTTIGDPVGAGVVASLARPGGNVTGLSLLATELSAKRVELLKEMLPALTRVAVLWNPNNASVVLKFKEIETAAKSLNIQVRSMPIREANDIERVLQPAELGNAEAVITTEDALQMSHRSRIIDLARQQKVPVASEFDIFARSGSLMSYGPSILDLWRRAADYVDKIFKGAKPADLPVEQPTRFELVLNLKSAKALGLAVPPTMLTRADKVIE